MMNMAFQTFLLFVFSRAMKHVKATFTSNIEIYYATICITFCSVFYADELLMSELHNTIRHQLKFIASFRARYTEP